MIQSATLINNMNSLNVMNQVFGQQNASKSVLSSTIGISQPFYTTQYTSSVGNISSKDMNFIKSVSNDMNKLYSSAHDLGKLEGEDENTVKEKTQAFVEDFNNAVDTLEGRELSNTTIDRLKDSLASIGETNKHTLEDIGITMGDDGKLSIDEEVFDTSSVENLGKVVDTLEQVGKKGRDVALKGLHTSSQDLLEYQTNEVQSMISDEDYNKAILSLASNGHFMKQYYAAQALFDIRI